MATLLPLQLQSKRKHMEFAWHHCVMAAFLGKLVKRWLVRASPQKQYHVQSGLLTEFVVWKSISVLQYSPAEITTHQWIRRDDFFLGFRVPALSYIPKFSLKSYCWSDGIFAKIQMSSQQCHPPECLLLLQGSFTPK